MIRMTPAIAIIISLIFMIMPAGAAIQAQPAVDNSRGMEELIIPLSCILKANR